MESVPQSPPTRSEALSVPPISSHSAPTKAARKISKRARKHNGAEEPQKKKSKLKAKNAKNISQSSFIDTEEPSTENFNIEVFYGTKEPDIEAFLYKVSVVTVNTEAFDTEGFLASLLASVSESEIRGSSPVTDKALSPPRDRDETLHATNIEPRYRQSPDRRYRQREQQPLDTENRQRQQQPLDTENPQLVTEEEHRYRQQQLDTEGHRYRQQQLDTEGHRYRPVYTYGSPRDLSPRSAYSTRRYHPRDYYADSQPPPYPPHYYEDWERERQHSYYYHPYYPRFRQAPSETVSRPPPDDVVPMPLQPSIPRHQLRPIQASVPTSSVPPRTQGSISRPREGARETE